MIMTATESEVFGNGNGSFGLEGNLVCQASAGVNPGATGADNVLAVYSLPAGSLDQAGREIAISASGGYAANGNTKTVKIIVGPASAVVGSTVGAGGTTIASTGAVATNGAGWSLEASIVKYGAAGSNTQQGIHSAAQSGSAVAALITPASLTLNEAEPILIAITGNAATTATDIVLNLLQVNACN
jgi:hypothetical protein